LIAIINLNILELRSDENLKNVTDCLYHEQENLLEAEKPCIECVKELWNAENIKDNATVIFSEYGIKEQQQQCYHLRAQIEDSIDMKAIQMRPFYMHLKSKGYY